MSCALVTGVQTGALPISGRSRGSQSAAVTTDRYSLVTELEGSPRLQRAHEVVELRQLGSASVVGREVRVHAWLDQLDHRVKLERVALDRGRSEQQQGIDPVLQIVCQHMGVGRC